MDNQSPRQNKSRRVTVPGAHTLFAEPPNDPRTKQELSVLPTLKVRGWTHVENVGELTTEFHMTIRTTVAKLTVKQASILLMVLNVESLRTGVDLTCYLAMEHLVSYLIKSGHDPIEHRDSNVRKTVLVTEAILQNVDGKWLNLQDASPVPTELADKIRLTGWLPNERTYNSWKVYWQPRKFLEVQIVPVDSFRERAKNSSERYSGYTKGYGNDGSPASPQITRKSAELDGETGDSTLPEYDLLEFEMYQNLLLAIEGAKARRKQEYK